MESWTILLMTGKELMTCNQKCQSSRASLMTVFSENGISPLFYGSHPFSSTCYLRFLPPAVPSTPKWPVTFQKRGKNIKTLITVVRREKDVIFAVAPSAVYIRNTHATSFQSFYVKTKHLIGYIKFKTNVSIKNLRIIQY